MGHRLSPFSPVRLPAVIAAGEGTGVSLAKRFYLSAMNWTNFCMLFFFTNSPRESSMTFVASAERQIGMIEAVIFDIDGTLVDSVDLHANAWQEALQHFGYDLPLQQVRHEIGKGGDQLLPDLLPPKVVESQGKEIEEYRAQIFELKYLSQVRAFPCVRELFERIRADGKKIALASSAKSDEIQIYKKLANIEDLVDVETSADDAEKSKPHPDIFDATLERLGGINPAGVLVVGDTPHDAKAASKARLLTIGMLCGGFPEIELRAAGSIAIFDDPRDLFARYDESPIHRES
jgi:HAD superfamily hydrolase (TIGR01549 family)